MKIYTSYFAAMSKLEKDGLQVISIARWQPKWYKGPTMLNVAPQPYMLTDKITREQYINYYKQILARQDVRQVIKSIEMFSGGKDVALLCYEKPGDFCHRHLLAEWIIQQCGIEVTEYDFADVQKADIEENDWLLF